MNARGESQHDDDEASTVDAKRHAKVTGELQSCPYIYNPSQKCFLISSIANILI